MSLNASPVLRLSQRNLMCDDDDEDAVCMDPFGDRETIVLTKCRHRYHADCRVELETAGFEGCSYRCEGSVLTSWVCHGGRFG